MSISPAPFYADVADGPEGGGAYWLIAEDGVKIRIAVWEIGEKGTVLVFPGRTEYVEKYSILAGELAERGYSTVAVDWRGQGLADRLIESKTAGYVRWFPDYQKDVRAVLAALETLDLPERLHLIAHSMGGCIGLRSLMEEMPVESVLFSGPMWGIALDSFRRGAAWTISSLSRHIGFDKVLAPGTVHETYVLANPFDDNMLTTDPEMYAFMQRQIETYPNLGIGGPTLAWLNEGLKECRDLKAMASPTVPCLTYFGSHERIVDVPLIHDRMARWPGGRLEIVENAEHEVLMEGKPVRDRILDDATAHFENDWKASEAS